MLLHHYPLKKAQLDAIPDDQRVLMVMLAHAANELSVLTKLFHFAASERTGNLLLIEARNAQMLTIGRLLAGKICECWNLFRTAYFATQISRLYAPLLDSEAKAAFDALGKYFGKENVIERVRNGFAFHYSPDQIKEGYTKMVPDEHLDMFLSKTNSNTLYVFAESIAGRALLNCINPTNNSRALGDLISDTSKIIGHLNIAIGACIGICLDLHVGEDLYSSVKEIRIDGAPDWKSIDIPYFIEIPE